MATLNVTWLYQSFRPSMGPPSPLMPWSYPGGKLSVTTDATGKVDGKLTIPLPAGAPVPELVLAVSGSITPALATGPFAQPDGIKLIGKGGRGSVNELIGYFVAGGASPVIAGTITSVQNDPAGE